MRIWLPIIVGLLVSACVARERTHALPAQGRFEAEWEASREWPEAMERWVEIVQPEAAYPHTTVVFGAEHEGKPGLHLGHLPAACDIAWRKREVLAATYRVTFSLSVDDGDFGRMELPESSYAWRIPPVNVQQGDVMVTATAQGRLRAQRPDAGTWSVARVVFRLDREPTPTSLYQHGSEVLVAAWGLALEPASIELADTTGRKYRVFLNESGPE